MTAEIGILGYFHRLLFPELPAEHSARRVTNASSLTPSAPFPGDARNRGNAVSVDDGIMMTERHSLTVEHRQSSSDQETSFDERSVCISICLSVCLSVSMCVYDNAILVKNICYI